jgi:hypothetical protein
MFLLLLVVRPQARLLDVKFRFNRFRVSPASGPASDFFIPLFRVCLNHYGDLPKHVRNASPPKMFKRFGGYLYFPLGSHFVFYRYQHGSSFLRPQARLLVLTLFDYEVGALAGAFG